MAASWRRWLIKWILIIGVLIFAIQYWIEQKSFLFDENDIAKIARKHTGGSPEEMFQKVLSELRSRYPGHILGDQDLQWVFMNAGGFMGSMCLLHASLTEYVLFFGTAVTTSGHSGRYWANITDTLLTGEFRQWKEGALHAVVYKQGDTIKHVLGEATAVHFEADTWMVEYGRGFIPSTLGFALSDTIFSTQDFVTMFYVFRAYTKALLLEASTCLSDTRDYIKQSL